MIQFNFNSIKFANIALILILFIFSCNVQSQELSKTEKKKLVRFARDIASLSIGYSESWKPPTEDKPWIMDCSNTVRYTYQENFKIFLPRTAYDQYIYSKKSNSFYDPPLLKDGSIDTESLRKKIKMGDLLFWIDTYKLSKSPPVTHTMVYLGKNKSNVMKMFGAGTFGKGEQTVNGGLDVYIFDPNRNIGCVKDNKAVCIRSSRFLGYSRILK